MEFATKGTGDAALATGIIGTALGVMNGGIPGILGGYNGYNGNGCVNREAFDLSMKLSASESEKALLQADLASEKKMVEVFNAATNRTNAVRDELLAEIRALDKKVDDGFAAQAVTNCKCSSAVNLLQNQVEQLYTMTKLVIPNASISPGWVS